MSRHHRNPLRTSGPWWRIGGAILALAVGLLVFFPAPGSAQQGTGWSQRADLREDTGVDAGGDSVLLCDPYENLHIIWGGEIDDRGYLFYQNDLEGELSAPVDIIATDDPLALHPEAKVSERTNRLHLIWAGAYIGGRLYHSSAPLALAADPKSWSRPTVLYAGTSSLGGTLAIDRNGRLHVIYGVSEPEGPSVSLQYITSDDDGQTWSPPKTIYTTILPIESDIISKLAIDGAGRLHVGVAMRSFQYGQRSEVGYLQSSDGGETWSNYVRVGDVVYEPPGVARMGAYAFGLDEIHLTWHVNFDRMHMVSTDGGQTWSKPRPFITLGAAFGGFNEMTQDSTGALHAVTGVGGGFYTEELANGIWGPLEAIDPATPVDPEGWQLVACTGNRLHASYNKATDTKELFYYTRQLPAPPRERKPIPPAAPVAVSDDVAGPASAQPSSTSAPADAGATTVTPVQSGSAPAQAAPSTSVALLVAILPVIALLALVFFIQRR